jgi:hypothetical protein
MFVVIVRHLIPRNFLGFTIFPFIVAGSKFQKEDKVFINHEKIHLRQQIEMLVMLFFIWYLLEFLVRFVMYKNFSKAYRNISFEREAYANEKNVNYIKTRKIWNFLTYF